MLFVLLVQDVCFKIAFAVTVYINIRIIHNYYTCTCVYMCVSSSAPEPLVRPRIHFLNAIFYDYKHNTVTQNSSITKIFKVENENLP